MDDALRQRLMQTFALELEEHARTLDTELLELERDPPEEEKTELLMSVFRSAHSLKGAARSVGLGFLESICHDMETFLGAVRKGEQTLGSDDFEVLFALRDALAKVAVRLREGQDAEDLITPELRRAVQTLGAGSAALPAGAAATVAPERSAGGEPDARQDLADPPDRREPSESARPAGRTDGPDREGQHEPQGRAESMGAIVRVSAERFDGLQSAAGELGNLAPHFSSQATELLDLSEMLRLWRREAGASSALGSAPTNRAESGSPGKIGERLPVFEEALERLAKRAKADASHLQKLMSDMDDTLLSLRLLPFGRACEGLERTVRDLASLAGKEVRLDVLGTEVEMDRSILEGLKAPLLHLVRNAVDHGVETAAERRRLGKSLPASVRVESRLEGARVEVEVSDDGAGLDTEALLAKAVEGGFIEKDADVDITSLVFAHGLSTAKSVTEVSGRGVGMDVVNSVVEALRGSVEVHTRAQEGTRFVLSLPLTLSMLPGLVVEVGPEVLVIDSSTVERVTSIRRDALSVKGGQEVMRLRESEIPVFRLGAVLGLKDGSSAPTHSKVQIVVLKSRGRLAAFMVDRLVTMQPVLVKSLGARLENVPSVSGGTVLGDGRIAVIVNTPEILRKAVGEFLGAPIGAAVEAPDQKRVLVVDDSLTSRTLLEAVLVAEGYDVAVAVDGVAGLGHLRAHSVDLVVTDIEMPRMDGFQLLREIRASEKLASLPVILSTARAAEWDRQRGMELGADAYMVKTAYDQTGLIETVRRLL